MRTSWRPTGELEADRLRWKRELYQAARLVLGAVAGLAGCGFDPSTDALLNTDGLRQRLLPYVDEFRTAVMEMQLAA